MTENTDSKKIAEFHFVQYGNKWTIDDAHSEGECHASGVKLDFAKHLTEFFLARFPKALNFPFVIECVSSVIRRKYRIFAKKRYECRQIYRINTLKDLQEFVDTAYQKTNFYVIWNSNCATIDDILKLNDTEKQAQ